MNRLVLLCLLGACAVKGETLWRERTPNSGVVRLETDRGQQWLDASYKRARVEMDQWCGAPAQIVSEGIVDTRDGVAWQETTTNDGTTRGQVTNTGAAFWEIRFRCATAATPTPPCCKS
jgi:hypothetical protein